MNPLSLSRLDQRLGGRWAGPAAYGLCLVFGVAGTAAVAQAQHVASQSLRQAQSAQDGLTQQSGLLTRLHTLRTTATAAQLKGIAVPGAAGQYTAIAKSIAQGDYAAAGRLISVQDTSLASLLSAKEQADQLAAARKGTLSGTVRDGTTALAGVVVTLLAADGTVAATITTDANGAYSFSVDAATYALTAQLVTYTDLRLDGVAVAAMQVTPKDLVMEKVPPPTPSPTPAPTPAPTSAPAQAQKAAPAATPKPASESTAYSAYSHTAIHASSGTFTADIMTFDLGSGHIKVIEDTADDGDCADGCSVKSVLSFVQQDGGFAGINGSYFCPTSYGASCAGKTNSFYWKQYNSRLQRMINPDNTLGEQDPFLVFEASGKATYLQHWTDYRNSGISAFAGISCTPTVVRDGQYAVDDSTLDDKERTAKISRGSIGLKGQTLYVVTIQGATVEDLGYAMQALGVDNAMNMDAGGSSGMVYNGSYKLGPGRAVPNVLVFGEQ